VLIVGCRTVSKGEAAIESVQKEVPQSASTLSVLQVDLSSDSSIDAAVEQITSKFGRLDILINNGGANFDVEIISGRMSIREAWNVSWDTNVAGTQVLTTNAMPLLLKSSDPRLIFITSGTSTLAETERHDGPMFGRINASPPAGWPKDAGPIPITSYRSSKCGLNMLMREWHRLLANDGVKVWAISPGFLATGLGGIGPEKLKQVGGFGGTENRLANKGRWEHGTLLLVATSLKMWSRESETRMSARRSVTRGRFSHGRRMSLRFHAATVLFFINAFLQPLLIPISPLLVRIQSRNICRRS
jgi:NAD(P)-dependent dehydrogenase (short-subunit alcohol dehydrogenase family)